VAIDASAVALLGSAFSGLELAGQAEKVPNWFWVIQTDGIDRKTPTSYSE
jgi:hypothetical protein